MLKPRKKRVTTAIAGVRNVNNSKNATTTTRDYGANYKNGVRVYQDRTDTWTNGTKDVVHTVYQHGAPVKTPNQPWRAHNRNIHSEDRYDIKTGAKIGTRFDVPTGSYEVKYRLPGKGRTKIKKQ